MMYFLVFFISVEATTIVIGAMYLRYMHQLYLQVSVIQKNTESNLNFKQVSFKTIGFILSCILSGNLLLGVIVSNQLTNALNKPAIIITLLTPILTPIFAGFISQFVPKIKPVLNKQLSWAIVIPDKQPNLLCPENITQTLKTLEKISDYKKYENNWLQKINRSLEKLISSGIEKNENSDYDKIQPIREFLNQFNNSLIISKIKKDVFDTLCEILKAEKDILFIAQIVDITIDEGIILPNDELKKIFLTWIQVIEKVEDLSTNDDSFKNDLFKKYKLFDLYVKCLQKLRINSKKLTSGNIAEYQANIQSLAWGNNGIMIMFSRIHSNLSKIDQDQKKIEYFQNFAEPVFQQLHDIYDDLLEFGKKPDKAPVYYALDSIVSTYFSSPHGNQDIRNKLSDLQKRLEVELGK